MVRPGLRTRAVKKFKVRTPGGKSAIQYRAEKVSKAQCGKCGNELHGVPRVTSAVMRNLSKTEKRPERIFGGHYCGACVKTMIQDKTRALFQGTAMPLQAGTVAVKTAGRDAGKFVVVTKVIDECFVQITGPKTLNGIKSKRTNIAHLEPTDKHVKVKEGAADADVEAAVKDAKLDVTFKTGLKF